MVQQSDSVRQSASPNGEAEAEPAAGDAIATDPAPGVEVTLFLRRLPAYETMASLITAFQDLPSVSDLEMDLAAGAPRFRLRGASEAAILRDIMAMEPPRIAGLSPFAGGWTAEPAPPAAHMDEAGLQPDAVGRQFDTEPAVVAAAPVTPQPQPPAPPPPPALGATAVATVRELAPTLETAVGALRAALTSISAQSAAITAQIQAREAAAAAGARPTADSDQETPATPTPAIVAGTATSDSDIVPVTTASAGPDATPPEETGPAPDVEPAPTDPRRVARTVGLRGDELPMAKSSGSVRALALAGIGVATLALVGLAAGALWLAGRAPSANVVEQTPQGAVTAITRTPTVAGASPAATPTGTAPPTPTASPTPQPTATPTPAPTPAPTPEPTPEATPEPPPPPPTPAPPPPPTPAAAPQVIVHLVQPGESAFVIARAYGITVQELIAANGLPADGRVLAGQRLVIPRR